MEVDLQRLPRLGGHIALDFVNTIDPRHGPNRVEYLPDYAALVAWAQWIQLVDPPARALLLDEARRHPRKATSVHRRALRLRDALFVAARPDRTRAEMEAALPVVAQELRRATAHVVLAPQGDGYVERFDASTELDRMLWEVVRAGAQLMTSPMSARVRECAGTNCGWLFLDTTKAGRRRWCSMSICGNRAKVERYRKRIRARA